MKPLYTVFAVTLNYKTYPQLKECLDALESSILPAGFSLHIIVIDSEFDREKLDVLRKGYKDVTFIPEEKNLGVGGGFNKGFKEALLRGADYVLMLTPDITPEKTVLRKLIETMEKDVSIGMASPKMLLTTTPPRIYFVAGRIEPRVKSSDHIGYGEVDTHQYDGLSETEFLNCATVLVRREVFEKVGFLDPEYFLYYEDIDWSLRVKRAGYKLVVVKNAIVWHEESSSVGKNSPRQDYYISRNLLWFVKKNFSLPQRMISYAYNVREAFGLVKDYLTGQNRKRAGYKLLGMRDFLLGKKGYKEIR